LSFESAIRAELGTVDKDGSYIPNTTDIKLYCVKNGSEKIFKTTYVLMIRNGWQTKIMYGDIGVLER